MNRITSPRFLIPLAIVILMIVTAYVGGQLAVQSHSPLSCVVEDDRTGGASGLCAWADRMGFATLPLRPPIQEVGSELPTSGNCLITAGNEAWNPLGEISEDDWLAMNQWIRRGNTLIVITTDSKSLPRQIEEHFTSSEPHDTKLHGWVPRIAWNEPKFLESRPNETELVPTWWGGQFSVNAAGPRLIGLPNELRLAGSDDASVLAGKSLGQGMIYLLLDDAAWANEAFDQADNAATLARILKRNLGPSGVLAFDEYRHGYGRIESFTTLFLSLPAAKQFSWMALALGLLWLWSSTRRLSPADEFRDVERRTALEYVESVAAMNQRARAAPLAVQAVLQRVRYLLQKRGVINDSVNTALERAERSVTAAERPVAPKHEIELVSELIELRRDLYGTRQSP